MDTRELFARLIKCEAGGEGFDGMRAVATVVMNRATVSNGEYNRISQGGNVRNIIEQTCQFSCLKTQIGGAPHTQNVYVLTPEAIHYEVADWALNGGAFTGVGSHCLWFMNPFSPKCPNAFPPNGTGYWFTRINQHCFFHPTEAYKDT